MVYRGVHVLSAAHHHDTLLYKSIMKPRVIIWSRDDFSPLAFAIEFLLSILRKRYVDEGNIHVDVGILLVFLLQAVRSLPEPFDLIFLNPVIALPLSFIWRIGM